MNLVPFALYAAAFVAYTLHFARRTAVASRLATTLLVAGALAHTFIFNRVYRRALDPLVQTFGPPPLRELTQFRHLSASYGFDGLSWWSW